MSGKARHPWRWILRSGKAKLDGNTLCISEGFNVARTGKHVTRDCGFCVQARQTPMGILCVFPRGKLTSTKARHPWRWILRSGKAKLDGNTLCISKGFNEARAQKHVTRDCGFCVQARRSSTGILCVFPRGLTKHEHRSTSPVAMDFAFRQGKPRWEYFVYFQGV